MIILIGGEKGGTGKTTVATNLACTRNEREKNLLLIDADKQGSSNAWSSVRNTNENLIKILSIQKFGNDLASVIKELNLKYKDIIIDAGGRDSVELRSAMVVADKIIVPIQTSQFDVWTMSTMDSLIEQVRAFNPSLKSFLLPNRVSTNPSVNELEEMREIASEFKYLKVLNSHLYERIAYRKAARSGMSVVELNTDKKAINEINNLYEEVFNEEK